MPKTDTNANATLEALLNATINTEEIKTEYIPVPEGVFPATVVDYEFKEFPANEPGKPPSLLLSIKLRLDDPDLNKELEQDEVIRRYETWINRDENGGLANNNIGFGRLLNAAGQHSLGEVDMLTALEACKGSSVMAEVRHKIYDGRVIDRVADVLPQED